MVLWLCIFKKGILIETCTKNLKTEWYAVWDFLQNNPVRYKGQWLGYSWNKTDHMLTVWSWMVCTWSFTILFLYFCICLECFPEWQVKQKPQEQSPKSTEISSDIIKEKKKGRRKKGRGGTGGEQQQKQLLGRWTGSHHSCWLRQKKKKKRNHFITLIPSVVIPNSLPTKNNSFSYTKPGFLILGTTDMLGWITLCCKGLSCAQ